MNVNNVLRNQEMKKWEQEFKITELLEEAQEYKKFEYFYESLPVIKNRLRTEESHLPLIYITSANLTKFKKKGIK